MVIHEANLVDYARMFLRGDPEREPRAHRRARAHGRRDQGAGRTPFVTPWRTIQLADKATGLAPSVLGLNLNPPNALATHRLDPADEVRGHLVGHAHRHDDLELGSEARRHHREHPAVHRFRRGQRARRRAGRGVEHRVGRRLDRQPRRLLLHPGLPRLRSRGRGRVRQGEGRAAHRAQRDLRRHPELRAPARQRLRAVPVAGARRDQVGIRHRPHQRGPLALLAVHGAALPPGDRGRGQAPASCSTCTSRCTTPASGAPIPT